jgi:hypothetical protein
MAFHGHVSWYIAAAVTLTAAVIEVLIRVVVCALQELRLVLGEVRMSGFAGLRRTVVFARGLVVLLWQCLVDGTESSRVMW